MIGQILRQRYKIIKQLGAGGFGETYLAEDLDIPTNPKPKCVVKRLQPQAMNPEIIRLFQQEGATLYKLGQNHTQIPKLFAYFQENQEFYLIQEYIDGHDLSQEITSGKRWSESAVMAFLQEILELLMYVHQNNVIHRDIKPENIMRRESDRKLILIDFGIVKELSSLVVNPSGKTSSTVRIGTPGYMPSEQASGKPKLSSDIYAVGMTAIFALTGIEPQQLPESNGEVIWQNKASVSNKLGEVLTKMVCYDYRQRFVNADDALRGLVNGVVKTGATMPISIVSKPYKNNLQIANKYLPKWAFVPIIILPIWAVFKFIKLPPIQQTASTPKVSPTPSIRASPKPKPTRIPTKISKPIPSPKPTPTPIISQPITSPTPTPTPTAQLTPNPTPALKTAVAVNSPQPPASAISKPEVKLNFGEILGNYRGMTVNKTSQKTAKMSMEISDITDLRMYLPSFVFEGVDLGSILGNIKRDGSIELKKEDITIDYYTWNLEINGKIINNKTISGTYKLIPKKTDLNPIQYGEFTVIKENKIKQ
jgi:serine/threonine protein kinase